MALQAGELRHRVIIQQYVKAGRDEDGYELQGGWVLLTNPVTDSQCIERKGTLLVVKRVGYTPYYDQGYCWKEVVDEEV